MKLCEEARYWCVTIRDNIISLLLLDELKDGELLALAKHWLRISIRLGQIGHTEVEVGTPPDAKRLFLI